MGTLLGLLAERRGSGGGYVAARMDGTVRRLGFRELHEITVRGAEVLAAAERPEKSTATALLSVRDPLDFIVAFFSAMAAGLVPIPGPSAGEFRTAHQQRLRGIVEVSRPAVILTDANRIESVRSVLDDGSVVRSVAELRAAPAGAGATAGQDAGAGSVAYIQYTSGSTSDPKPAELRQAQVFAQLRQAANAYAETSDSVTVNWVPLYHDMGLVTSVLRPLYSGYRSVILAPDEFIRRPGFWVRQLSEWSATHTSAPDFGYALAARRPEDLTGLDLSGLGVARSAGETVRLATLREFSRVYGPAGFRYQAFSPSYGLAEAVLTVTTHPVGTQPRTVELSRAAFREGRVAAPTADENPLSMVSCGPPLDGTTVRILDDAGAPLTEDRRIGEVWIAGPQVAARPGDEIDGTPGYRTGDYGFLDGGHLVLAGRSGERFQIRGVNYYSSEIETVVALADPRFRAGRIAVFLVGDADAEQEVVVLAEVREDAGLSAEDGQTLRECVRREASREVGVSVSRTLLLPAGTLPVTTSGKLRRGQCRSMYEAGVVRALG